MSIQVESPPVVEIMDDLDQPQEHLGTITESDAGPLLGERGVEPKDKCVCVCVCVYMCMYLCVCVVVCVCVLKGILHSYTCTSYVGRYAYVRYGM